MLVIPEVDPRNILPNNSKGGVPWVCPWIPTCRHLREQKIGIPYEHVLGLVPGLSMESIQGSYCYGNGGIMGLEQGFHRFSVKIASILITMVKAMRPEILLTDYLTCRMQFNQFTPCRAMHPIDILR